VICQDTQFYCQISHWWRFYRLAEGVCAKYVVLIMLPMLGIDDGSKIGDCLTSKKTGN